MPFKSKAVKNNARFSSRETTLDRPSELLRSNGRGSRRCGDCSSTQPCKLAVPTLSFPSAAFEAGLSQPLSYPKNIQAGASFTDYLTVNVKLTVGAGAWSAEACRAMAGQTKLPARIDRLPLVGAGSLVTLMPVAS